MRSISSRIFALLIVVSMVAASVAAQNGAVDREDAVRQSPVPLNPDGLDAGLVQLTADRIQASETGLYIVRLKDPSLAAYEGGLPGLESTSPSLAGARKLDVSAPASLAYLVYLSSRQAEALQAIERDIGRSPAVPFQYLNVLNAMAVELDLAEAERIAQLPGVLAVYPDTLREIETDEGPLLIGAPSIWEGETGSGLATRGEGVIVGMLDTGVNPEHPSFAAVDGEGYIHTNPYGSGNFVGVCDPDDPSYDSTFPCNDKLIGAWNLHSSSPNARDWNNHGSHVGGTIAGNIHEAAFLVGNDLFTATIHGVAPRANIISYLVCRPSCPSTSSVAAVNQAIADGVDVLNYSISGVDNPWMDAVDLAFLDAFNAGMFVSASAGNAGPGPGTVAKTGPWNASTAASTHQRIFANTANVKSPTPPPNLVGMEALQGTGQALFYNIQSEVRYAGDVDPGNHRGCNPFPGQSFVGVFALIQRGDCTFEIKVNHAIAAGAAAVVIFNNVGGPPIVMGGLETTGIPSVMVSNTDGDALVDFIEAQFPTPVVLELHASAARVVDPEWQDIMAGFSSRGPSQFEMLAPTYTAPGVNILAAGFDGHDAYVFLQGTSMSSPHSAGAGALMMALNPDWSPAEVRSALASTTVTEGLLKEDAATPADPFDIGSGRLNLDAAGRVGLVMDETHANFVAANPATGGDPKTLNLPAFVNKECAGECTWTRTVKSVAGDPVTYNADFAAPDGVTVTVTPSTFTLAPGETQELEITVNVGDQTPGAWFFADLFLDPAAGQPLPLVASVHYPIAVIPQEGEEVPAIYIDPASLAAVLEPDSSSWEQLSISNLGEGTLVWTIEEAEALFGISDILFDNGPFVTHPGVGPGGLDHSVLQNQTLGMLTLGANVSLPTYRIADNLTVTDPEGWDAYQTGSGTISTFNHGNYQISDGPPDDPASTLVYGDLTTNRFVSTDWTNAYRVSQTTVDTQRPIMHIVGEGGFYLPEGTYWLDWHLDGAIASGPWQPPITILGQTTTGDAMQFASGAWQPVLDGRLGTPQGAPFTIEDSVATEPHPCDVLTNIEWLSVDPHSGVTEPGESDIVTVTFDSTGLELGLYEANLCVFSNDPIKSLVVVPVIMEVAEVDEAILEYSPGYIEDVVEVGGSVSNTVTVTNTGTIPFDFIVSIGDYNNPMAMASETTSSGSFEIGGYGPTEGLSSLAESAVRHPEKPFAQQSTNNLLLNQLPNQNNSRFADSGCDLCGTGAQSIAENFVLTETATIGGVNIWSGYFSTDTPVPDNITVIFHENAAGVPGPVIYSKTGVSNVRTQTGVILFGVHEYFHELTLAEPVTLNPGTYWIELFNTTGFGTDDYFWETGNLDPVNSLAVSAWATSTPGVSWNFDGGTNLAIQLIEGSSTGGWASADPTSGTVAPGEQFTFEVIYDAASLYQVGTYTANLSFSGNFVNDPLLMPLTMHLECLTCGFLEGEIFDGWTLEPISADITIEGLGGFNITLTGDSYNISVPADTYTITVEADGYFTEWATVELEIGETITTNFALTPIFSELDYSPDAFVVDVGLGTTTTRTLAISNLGTEAFDFTLVDVELSAPEGGIAGPAIVCPPDAYGYSCTDSTEADGLVTYNFEDISGTGTSVSLGDDQVSPAIPMNFDFNYYGIDYTDVYISSNGFLTVLPGQPNGCCTGGILPSPTIPNGVIAGWWEDLNPSAIGTIHYQALGAAPFRYFIVQFTNVPHLGGGNLLTKQYKYFESSNNIEVHYMAAPSDGGTHSAGIKNLDGTIGLQYYRGTSSLPSELAVCYLYPGQFSCGSGGADAEWLSQDPDSGTVEAGETFYVTVTFDATEAVLGAYTAEIIFTGTFDNAVLPMPVTMNVVEELPGEPPVAGFTFEPAEPFVGDLVEFTNTTTGTEPIEYLWDFGDGATSTAVNPTHVYTEAGTYMVTLHAENEYGEDTFTADIVVQEEVITYGVSLTVDEDELDGMPGTMAMFDLRVTNEGSVPDTFELYFEDNDWEVELSTDMTPVLDPGEWVDINAMVYIPADAMAGDWDTVMVYAVSMGEPEHWDNAMLKTTTMAVYGLELEADMEEKYGLPGDLVVFELTLTNLGNAPDTFKLMLEGSGWGAALSDTEVELEAGASAEVAVSVQIPADAEDGEQDSFTVLAASQSDDQLSAQVELTVTAVEEMPPGEAPVASFTISPEVPLIGQVVQFTNTTVGTEPITYLWTFGDGATSTEKHPTHVYTEDGAHTVTLAATNAYGTHSVTAVIVVGDLPSEPNLTLTLSVEPSPILLGQPATFTALVSNIGDAAVHQVVASGEMPAHVTFVEASAACDFTDNVLTCDLGTIEPGESASAWVTVIFTATGPFTIGMDVGIPDYDPVSGTIDVLVETQLFLPLINR
jgi:uncharacterized repeat protein (TIGR01451 family)